MGIKHRLCIEVYLENNTYCLCDCETQMIYFEITECLMRPVFALQEETESTDAKATEQMKKPKGLAPQTRQKPKKESKKKR